MKKITTLFFACAAVLPVLLITGGCTKKTDAPEPRPDSTHVELNEKDDNFSVLILNGAGEFILSQSNTPSIIIEGDSSATKHVATKISTDSLTVDIPKLINAKSKVIVRIASPEFSSIICNGASKILSITKLVPDTLAIKITGTLSLIHI